jgi:preprotein translocase subunit SecE
MVNPFRKVRIFFSETIQELKKASWPSRLELRDSTVVVIIATIIIGMYITLADFSVYNWVTFLTKLVHPDFGVNS